MSKCQYSNPFYKILFFLLFFFSSCICSVELKLLSIIVCTKLCVQLRARFCTLAQLLSKIMSLKFNRFKNKLYLVIFVQTGLTPLKCTWTVCRTLSPVLISNYPLNESFGLLQIHIQDFASALLENFNCKVGVITSLLTLSQAFDNYVHFNKRYSSKSLKATENYN